MRSRIARVHSDFPRAITWKQRVDDADENGLRSKLAQFNSHRRKRVAVPPLLGE